MRRRHPQPIQLLCVEDDPSLSFVLEEALSHTREAHIDAAMASSLDDALARLDEGGIELVLLDLSLPDSDGLETLERVRRRAPETPVIVLTGNDDPDLERRVLDLGVADYLLKGEVGSKTLVDSIRHALGQRRRPRAS